MAGWLRLRRRVGLAAAGVDELLDADDQDDTPWPILEHQAWLQSIESALHGGCMADPPCDRCQSAGKGHTEDRYIGPPATREQ